MRRGWIGRFVDVMWCSIFSTAKVVNLDTFSSDHSTIFLDFSVPIFHKKERDLDLKVLGLIMTIMTVWFQIFGMRLPLNL